MLCKEKHARFRNTLAWARIDLDFNTGEALVEELSQVGFIASSASWSENTPIHKVISIDYAPGTYEKVAAVKAMLTKVYRDLGISMPEIEAEEMGESELEQDSNNIRVFF